MCEYMYVCVVSTCMCMCVREREKEKERDRERVIIFLVFCLKGKILKESIFFYAIHYILYYTLTTFVVLSLKQGLAKLAFNSCSQTSLNTINYFLPPISQMLR